MLPLSGDSPLNPDPLLMHFQQGSAAALDPYRGVFRAKLTAKTDVSGVWNYDWTEQTFDPSTGASTDANPGRSGSYSGAVANSPALEVNNAALDVSSAVYVWMKFQGIVNGVPYYEFQGPPPLLPWKDYVRAATTATIISLYDNDSPGTLTGLSNGALPDQDGVTLDLNDDLLVKDQSNPLERGIYTLTQVGDGSTPFILTRRHDADVTSVEIGPDLNASPGLAAATVTVTEGTTLKYTTWQNDMTPPFRIDGSTLQTWRLIPKAGTGGTDTALAMWDGTYVLKASSITVDGFGVTQVPGGIASTDYRAIVSGITYSGATATVSGLVFKNGIYISGTVTGFLTDPGDGIASGTYPV